MPEIHDLFPMAACRDSDPALFFSDSAFLEAAAKTLCFDCPEKVACLNYALRFHEYGIWGGTNERERKRLNRNRLRA